MTAIAPVVSPMFDVFQAARTGIIVPRAPDPAHVAPDTWRDWVRTLFPRHVRYDFAHRHVELWEWGWRIELGDAPRPFIAIWSRGGAKSTSAELLTTGVAVRGRRRYGLYVSETQEQADNKVGNIGALLESPELELYYPQHAQRAVGKFGSSRGWRRNRLRTAGGFTIDAMGLDSAARGAKVEEYRPDWIVIDDVDGKHDSPQETAKKIETITTSILPAGAENVAVLCIQNVIIPTGFFGRMVDGSAEYLSRRIVSGPHPAVRGLKVEERDEPAEPGAAPTKRAVIVAGIATWEGQSLEVCQKQIDDWGLSAFKKEAQHDVFSRAEGLAIDFDDVEHYADKSDEEIKALVNLDACFGGIDFGLWRFGFVGFAADPAGVAYRIGEHFSQREELGVRARAIHEWAVRVGIIAYNPATGECRQRVRFPIWGDSANPTDILEINKAWAKGWDDEATGRHVTSPLTCVGVGKGPGMISTAIDRINDKLGAGALKFVRSVGVGDRWRWKYNASSDGVPMSGSRLMWEIKHWKYATPKGEQAQSQVPDDHTADGADLIAAIRYALMSWWKAAKEPDDGELNAFDPKVLEADAHKQRLVRNRFGGRKKRRASPTQILDPEFGEY